jgi:hypothetical protein
VRLTKIRARSADGDDIRRRHPGWRDRHRQALPPTPANSTDAALRLRAETGSKAAITIVAIATTGFVLVLFAVQTLRNEPATFVAMIAIMALSVVLDLT